MDLIVGITATTQFDTFKEEIPMVYENLSLKDDLPCVVVARPPLTLGRPRPSLLALELLGFNGGPAHILFVNR